MAMYKFLKFHLKIHKDTQHMCNNHKIYKICLTKYSLKIKNDEIFITIMKK